MIPLTPRSTLFPYTTLFRSCDDTWSAARCSHRNGATTGEPPRRGRGRRGGGVPRAARARADRKSTRLNSSHLVISYAVFCLKKKKKKRTKSQAISRKRVTAQ